MSLSINSPTFIVNMHVNECRIICMFVHILYLMYTCMYVCVLMHILALSSNKLQSRPQFKHANNFSPRSTQDFAVSYHPINNERSARTRCRTRRTRIENTNGKTGEHTADIFLSTRACFPTRFEVALACFSDAFRSFSRSE